MLKREKKSKLRKLNFTSKLCFSWLLLEIAGGENLNSHKVTSVLCRGFCVERAGFLNREIKPEKKRSPRAISPKDTGWAMAAKAKFRKSGNGEKTADKSTVGERRATCCRKGIVALDAYFTWADTWVLSAEKPFATIIKKIKVDNPCFFNKIMCNIWGKCEKNHRSREFFQKIPLDHLNIDIFPHLW